ncbi:MAG: c-type cytochrome [Chlorobium sp.]|jgi:cytochrome subunit of sulfide dehydrogenase|nr:MAG: c-type cytochrome [Chlorobium sp.]
MALNLRVWLTACAFSSAVFTSGSVALAAGSSAKAKPVRESAAKAAEENPRGLVLSLSCTSCHGTDGKSVGIIPSIYGKSTEYIEASMLAFKSGARYSTVMSRHAKGYTDEEIRLIAEYFGRLSHNKK